MKMYQNRKRHFSYFQISSTAVALLGTLNSAHAAVVYLDKNSTTPGSGITSASSTSWNAGTTSTSLIWSQTADGSGATAKYSTFNDGTADVVFSAGTDADGLSYSVQATGTTVIAAHSITIKDGTVALTGSTSPGLSLGAGGITLLNNNSASLSSAAALSLTANQTWTNNGTGTFTITASATNSAISGNFMLTLAGVGAFSFGGGTNTLSGGVEINGPAIKTTQAGAFDGGNLNLNAGSLTVGSVGVTVANPYSITGGFGLGGTTAHLTLSGAGSISNAPTVTLNDTVGGGTVLGATPNSNTLTLDSNLTLNGSGNATVNDAIGQDSTNRNLNVTGSGVVILAGTDTYAGATFVQGGTLRVNGNLAATSRVNVGDSSNANAFHGILGGSGVINSAAPVNIYNGSTISTGSTTSTGTLDTGSETWASGSTDIWKLNTNFAGGTIATPGIAGLDFDQLDIAGSLSLSNSANYALDIKSISEAAGDPFDGTQSYTWTIATTTAGITGFAPGEFSFDTSGFTGTNYVPSPNNSSTSGLFSLALDGTTDNLQLTYTPASVPEPASLILIAATIPMTLSRRRRR
jgi:autotransporter-associated beta strand protein